MRTASKEKRLSGAVHRVFHSVWAARPPRDSGTTAILTLAVGWRLIGSRHSPSAGGLPLTRARYSLCTSCKGLLSTRRSCSVSATSRMPPVSLSSRCTMPGRWPSILPSCGKRPSRRCTRVCSGQEGQGCTVRPAGLLHTTMCLPCQSSSRCPSSACKVVGFRQTQRDGLPGPHFGIYAGFRQAVHLTVPGLNGFLQRCPDISEAT